MHAEPPVFHRDIREPNIIRSFDGDKWFLIDWTDASTCPTRAVQDFDRHEHSPRVFEDNHGHEVDIWGVARYMEAMANRATCNIAQTRPIREMARRWMGDLSTTATRALEEVQVGTYHWGIQVVY